MLNLLMTFSMVSATYAIPSYSVPEVIFSDNGPMVPVLNNPINPIGNIDIDAHGMLISMDITIDSLPTVSDWYNIFLVGSNDNRQPGIWINDDSTSGFHVTFDWQSGEYWNTGTQLEANKGYNIQIYYDSTNVKIVVDEEITNTGTKLASSGVITNLPITIGGDFHSAASTVSVSNIVIQKNVNPYFDECRTTLTRFDELSVSNTEPLLDLPIADVLLNEIKLLQNLVLGLFGFIFVSIVVIVCLWNRSKKNNPNKYKVVDFDIEDTQEN
eukprot:CAMPEP_0201575814 /NCGR_PEP_ID=MMETSP0190_2-20130828/21227_1 /ASSEMBLY_ACC=CAM_ASM_000263 /TAXON_ID=37353 /ORGANISM="Rosalina sp." /LENGTH=269 /DNA_ID=CAMNT_0048005897 /DNA_START=71 /DNA_END=880 /DNA_ORIENTATION=-